ncbi:MAG: NAD-dependent epimerase/dehydratase family protein [Lutibacter sp.]
MKIAVTGATGFVGTNLLPYLQNAGYTTLGVSRNPSENEISYGALSEETWNNANAMVHLAGKAHDLKKTSNESEYFEVNFEFTKKLYDQFLASDARQFIYISSVKAVTDSVDGILSEDEVPNPFTAYGKSKLMAEAYIMANLPANKKVYILRPCMIHGPGNKGNLNLLYSLVSKGFPWPLGAFENQRSFLSIENFCFVIKELLSQNNISSGIYNVADDEPLSTNQLIQLIAVSQNKQAKIFNISKGFISQMAKFGDKLYLPLNTERLQKLTESYLVSNVKIKQAIGKSFPVNVKEGLLKTFKSFSDHVK